MKAITLWQPWASFLACGIKQYETRGWRTDHRGPLLVHASAREPAELKHLWVGPGYRELLAQLFAHEGCVRCGDGWDGLPRGKILGVVELRRVIRTEAFGSLDHQGRRQPAGGESERLLGDWSKDRFAWHCESPNPFKAPIAAKGKQGLWEFGGALPEARA